MVDYKHKNIVKGIEGFKDKFMPGLLYVAILEYCTGGDLEDFIKVHGGKEELMPVYLRLFYEMTDAIAYMHNGERKHMHRDLKPANVLLMFPSESSDFKKLIVKLGDFGLSKDMKLTM